MAAANGTDRTTIRLHRALYAHGAIADAAKSFGDFASFALRIDDEHFVVDVSDVDREVEGDVVAEFTNFALANTAVRRKNAHA
jgi:hypothetical protein